MIKNSVEQGRQAVVTLTKGINKSIEAQFDLIIVGAGSTGISASLTAKRHNTSTLILEQDALGGTVFTFPRAKIVMTSSLNLPLYGKVRLNETSKSELLNLWNEVLSKNSITIRENTKVESISTFDKHSVVKTLLGEEYRSKF